METLDLMVQLAKHDLRIVEEREDGSGVVEVPILAVGGAVKRKDLDEIAANARRYSRPVPVGFPPHVDYGDRGGPQPGFVEALAVRGNLLWAQIDCGPSLFQAVRGRAFRGYSVEMRKDIVLRTGQGTVMAEFKGWVLVGGIFTNRPAAGVHFRMAADAIESDGRPAAGDFHRLPGRAPEGDGMSKDTGAGGATQDVVSKDLHDERVRNLQGEVSSRDSRIEELNATVGDQRDKIADLSAKVEKLESERVDLDTAKSLAETKARNLELRNRDLEKDKQSLTTEVGDMRTRLEEQAKESNTEKLTASIEAAVASGVPAAAYDGWKPDPTGWAVENYGSVENALKRINLDASLKLKPLSTGRPEKSGKAPVVDSPEGGDRDELDAQVDKLAERAGIAPEFAGVTTAEEAMKVGAELKKAKRQTASA